MPAIRPRGRRRPARRRRGGPVEGRRRRRRGVRVADRAPGAGRRGRQRGGPAARDGRFRPARAAAWWPRRGRPDQGRVRTPVASARRPAICTCPGEQARGQRW